MRGFKSVSLKSWFIILRQIIPYICPALFPCQPCAPLLARSAECAQDQRKMTTKCGWKVSHLDTIQRQISPITIFVEGGGWGGGGWLENTKAAFTFRYTFKSGLKPCPALFPCQPCAPLLARSAECAQDQRKTTTKCGWKVSHLDTIQRQISLSQYQIVLASRSAMVTHILWG